MCYFPLTNIFKTIFPITDLKGKRSFMAVCTRAVKLIAVIRREMGNEMK